VPTGAKGRYGASEASVMARLLRERGVPQGQILLEETGTDTLSSVRAVARMVRDRGLPVPVHVATSGYHLPRCLLLLRLAGIDARACPPPASGEGFWPRWFWRTREAAAIPYDAALMVCLLLACRV
jgi:uncharacterized SAM-binding protein YcdF (DUF218 family)